MQLFQHLLRLRRPLDLLIGARAAAVPDAAGCEIGFDILNAAMLPQAFQETVGVAAAAKDAAERAEIRLAEPCGAVAEPTA